MQTIDVRPYTFVNGRAPGAVRSISFGGSGNAYVGTTDGSNRLLKFSSSGQFLDAFAMPAPSKGVAWFDIATDQRTSTTRPTTTSCIATIWRHALRCRISRR